jgi:hypothetical protein
MRAWSQKSPDLVISPQQDCFDELFLQILRDFTQLLGTFRQGWNARHQQRGHVFPGRWAY